MHLPYRAGCFSGRDVSLLTYIERPLSWASRVPHRTSWPWSPYCVQSKLVCRMESLFIHARPGRDLDGSASFRSVRPLAGPITQPQRGVLHFLRAQENRVWYLKGERIHQSDRLAYIKDSISGSLLPRNQRTPSVEGTARIVTTDYPYMDKLPCPKFHCKRNF